MFITTYAETFGYVRYCLYIYRVKLKVMRIFRGNKEIKVMRYIVKMVVGKDIMNVANTNNGIEAGLILAALEDDGNEAWICDNIQEIMCG
jgi:fibronectin type 3 domain-containing protein